MRLTTIERGEHHLTIPAHAALRIGTLAAILSAVAAHFDSNREDVARRLFEKT